MEALPSARDERIDLWIPGFKARFYNPPAPWPLVIHTRDRQKDWVVYEPLADPVAAPTPSTIVYKDNGYRIMNVRRADADWIYCLAPVPDGDLWLSPIFLNCRDLERESRRQKEIERLEWLSSISGFYQPLLGWLPSRIQDFLSDKLCFNSADASRHNALLEVAAGFYVAFRYSYLPRGIWIGVAMVLLGFVRWAHVFASGEPCGQMLLEGAHRMIFFLWPPTEKQPLWK